jgi:hypothetical protein
MRQVFLIEFGTLAIALDIIQSIQKIYLANPFK